MIKLVNNLRDLTEHIKRGIIPFLYFIESWGWGGVGWGWGMVGMQTVNMGVE